MKISRLASSVLHLLSLSAVVYACSADGVDEPAQSASEALSSPSGKITGELGLCVDARGAGTANHTVVQVYVCNGTAAQKWTPTDGALVGIGGKCLDVAAGQNKNGSVVQLYDCNGTDAQKWHFANGQLVGLGGKCLDIPINDVASGQALQIWDCGSGANQKFAFSANGATADAGAPAVDAGSGGGGSAAGIARARSFVAPLTLGIQIPRGQQSVLTYDGTKLSESPQFFAYLAGLGVTHVGFSYPWTPAGSAGGDLSFVASPSVHDGFFSSMVAAAKLANAAGLKVLIRLTDNLQIPKDFGATLDAWLTTSGSFIASSGLDPAKNVLIPWGEMSGSTNAACNPLSAAGDRTLRAVLPRAAGWILGVSGAYWASSTVINGDSSGVGRSLVTLADGSVDDQVIYMWDDYPFHDQGLEKSEAGFAADAAKWQAAHGGAPILNLETGDWHGNYDTNPGNPGAWASSYLPIAQGVGRFAPMLWDFSNADASANQVTLQNGTEAKLSAANEAGLRDACAWSKAQSFQGSDLR